MKEDSQIPEEDFGKEHRIRIRLWPGLLICLVITAAAGVLFAMSARDAAEHPGRIVTTYRRGHRRTTTVESRTVTLGISLAVCAAATVWSAVETVFYLRHPYLVFSRRGLTLRRLTGEDFYPWDGCDIAYVDRVRSGRHTSRYLVLMHPKGADRSVRIRINKLPQRYEEEVLRAARHYMNLASGSPD